MLYSTRISTALGVIRLFADEQGLTRIDLPGTADGRPDSVPRPEPTAKEGCLVIAARQIREYCAGERTVFDLPLSVTGTAFQRQVWDIIRRIPYGRTMSYGGVASELGSAGKARAVGGAAHANSLPLVIPCHRVVGADGSLTGFGSGLEMKEQLLRLEKNVLAGRTGTGNP